MAPDRSAEAGAGAAGCAYGSHHIPNGYAPAFTRKPSTIRATAVCATAGRAASRPAPARAMSSKANELPAADTKSATPKNSARVPACVTKKYRKPAVRSEALSLWKITSRYELRAISSHGTKKKKKSSTTTTPAIPAMNRSKGG